MKKIGFIGYGLRSETMMRAFRGIAAPIEVNAGPRFRFQLHIQGR